MRGIVVRTFCTCNRKDRREERRGATNASSVRQVGSIRRRGLTRDVGVAIRDCPPTCASRDSHTLRKANSRLRLCAEKEVDNAVESSRGQGTLGDNALLARRSVQRRMYSSGACEPPQRTPQRTASVPLAKDTFWVAHEGRLGPAHAIVVTSDATSRRRIKRRNQACTHSQSRLVSANDISLTMRRNRGGTRRVTRSQVCRSQPLAAISSHQSILESEIQPTAHSVGCRKLNGVQPTLDR